MVLYSSKYHEYIDLNQDECSSSNKLQIYDISQIYLLLRYLDLYLLDIIGINILDCVYKLQKGLIYVQLFLYEDKKRYTFTNWHNAKILILWFFKIIKKNPHKKLKKKKNQS